MSEQIQPPGNPGRQADNRTAIEHQALALILRAAAVGLNVTIEKRPLSVESPTLKSFLQQEYFFDVNVWERRS
jgi:hypothetical protein